MAPGMDARRAVGTLVGFVLFVFWVKDHNEGQLRLNIRRTRNWYGMQRLRGGNGVDGLKNMQFLSEYHLNNMCKDEIVDVSSQAKLNRLIDVDPDRRDRIGWTGLHYASLFRNEKATDDLLNAGADPNVVEGITSVAPVHICAFLGDFKNLRILIQKGADVNIAMSDGATPLYIAASNNFVEAMRVLLYEGNADPNKNNAEGISPLLIAVNNNCAEAVELLIQNKVFLNRREPLEGVTPLYMAAQNGYYDIIKLLLDAGVTPNSANDAGASALFIACQNNHVDCAKLLLDHGASVEQADHYGSAPLAIALAKSNTKIIEMLLKHGANVDRSVNSDGVTPLYVAANTGQPKQFLKLLALGANVSFTTKSGQTFLHAVAGKLHTSIIEAMEQTSFKLPEGLVDHADSRCMTPLLFACSRERGDEDASEVIKIITFLLQNGADIDHRNDNLCTALFLSVASGSHKISKFLLEKGADVGVADHNDITPFWVACKRGDIKLAGLLKNRGAEVDREDCCGVTPLQVATYFDHVDVVRTLLFDWEANLYHINQQNTSAPWIAAQKGNENCLRFFLKHCKVSPNYLGPNRTSLLWAAAANNHKDCVKMLIDYGAHVNTPTIDGFTPLYVAAQAGHKEVCKVLLEAAADANDAGGAQPPLLVAIEQNDHKLVKLLLDMGANINTMGQYGRTGLHMCAEKNRMDMMKLLLENGANPNIENEARYTPTLLCVQAAHRDCLKLLIHYGADIEIPDKNNGHAVHIACDRRDIETLKILVNAGANLNSKTSMGWTPPIIAAIDKNEELLRYLAVNGANFTLIDNLGWRADEYWMVGSKDNETHLYHLIPEGYLDARGEYMYKYRAPHRPDNSPKTLPEIIRERIDSTPREDVGKRESLESIMAEYQRDAKINGLDSQKKLPRIGLGEGPIAPGDQKIDDDIYIANS